MQFKKADIAHMADLARLELSAAELASYGAQLSAITAYIEQLQKVKTSSVALAPILYNIWREDVVEDWEAEENGQALSQGKLERGLLKVKRVL